MKQILTLLLLFTIGFGFSQNDNPYAEFGYKGNTLKTPQERINYMLIIPNKDTTSIVKNIGFEAKKGKYYLFDKDDNIVLQDTLIKEQILRFFAIDPLTKKYPHYTPYSFSGNKVIAHIELEGLEDLDIKVYNKATPNTTGKALLSITMEHQIVTKGIGQLHNQALIDPKKYKSAYDYGDLTLYSTNLPSQTQSANFLSGKKAKWARIATTHSDLSKREKYRKKLTLSGVKSFYSIEVDYNYTLVSKPNTTLDNAVNWVKQNIAGRGIIFNAEKNIRPLIGKTNYNQNTNIYSGIITANKIANSLSINEGAAGLSEGISGRNTNFNFVVGNPMHFGAGSTYSFPLNATKVMVHEVGHNNAKVNIHGTGNYEYIQSGTQSYTNPKPTRTNTINTINDQTNRKSL